ncbi:hypothetical protein ACHAWF_015819 [Thalassiosira exigua]
MLQAFVCVAAGTLYRLSRTRPEDSPCCYNPRNFNGGGAVVVSVPRRDMAASILASVALAVQAASAAVLTSPSGGGPGSVAGTLYYASWAGVALAFETCLRYLELHGTRSGGSGRDYGGAHSRIHLVEDATIYEDDDERDESLLMLRNGSEDGGSRRSRPRLLRNGSEAIVVEDASTDEEDQYTYQRAPPTVGPSTAPPSTYYATERSALEPTNVLDNHHFGGGIDPVEERGSVSAGGGGGESRRLSRPSSREGSSGTDPVVGSIDARSAQLRYYLRDENYSAESDGGGAPPAEEEASTRKPSGHYADFDLEDYPEEDLHNSQFFDRLFDKNSGRDAAIRPSVTSYHMDQVEDLDEEPPTRRTRSQDIIPMPGGSGSGGLSPLKEGSGEEKSPSSESSRGGGGRRPGDNLKAVQAAHTRSRSRENNLASGRGSGGGSGRPGSRKTASVSTRTSGEQSRSHGKQGRFQYKPQASRRSMAPSATSTMTSGAGDHSAVLTEDDDSDSSESNPPPTISEGQSTKDDLSGFSALDTPGSGKRRGGAPAPAAAHPPPPPPPPPFSRRQEHQQQKQQHDDFDAESQYTSSAPVRVVSGKGSHGETDTIVSDPTLDPWLAPVPEMQAPESHRGNRSAGARSAGAGSASSGSSYQKRMSDETQPFRQSSSDEHNVSDPSSQDAGGAGEVDNIVAAALAYAERAHGESDQHGISASVRGSGTTPSTMGASAMGRPPAHGGPARAAPPPRGSRGGSGGNLRDSTTTGNQSSSIHSFFSEGSGEDEGGKGAGAGAARAGGARAGGGVESLRESSTSSLPAKSVQGVSLRGSHSTGNPVYLTSSAKGPVDDLVALALSQAQGQLDARRPQMTPMETMKRSRSREKEMMSGGGGDGGDPRPGMERTTSEYSAQYWGGANAGVAGGKSVGSMYSADTESVSQQDAGMNFDC